MDDHNLMADLSSAQLPDEKIILCVDMDAYFASVEQKANPALRGKPIAVSGGEHRSVVTAASYEAKAFGVKAGMPMHEARKLCPHILFVVGSPGRYTHTSRELAKIFSRFSPDIEVYSIDEAFLDITDTEHLFGGPLGVGQKIKHRVSERFGINCTVGIGPNILVAKMASTLSKPDGLRWIHPHEAAGAFADLGVQKLWGIGRSTAAKLEVMGITTCGDLANTPASLLRNRFGIYGETLREMGMGVHSRPLLAREQEVKSVGHSFTLTHDIWERGEIKERLLRLSEMVCARARGYGYQGKTVSLTLRYSDFETFSRQKSLKEPTNDTHVVHRCVCDLLDKIRLKKRVRLLGVNISKLVKDQGQLLLIEEERKRAELLRAMDSVNDRYGKRRLGWATDFKMQRRGAVISPSWRPKGIKTH